MMLILNLKTTNESEVVKKTVEVLKKGGLVVYPTETLYGIGVDATNQEAVNKLLKYKARREGKPLSVACADKKIASKFVHINKATENIYNTLLPGPVTVVSKSKHTVAKGVESELGTLGIRIPDYPLILKIIKAFGKPITSTSANASYKKRPYHIRDIFNNISAKQKKLIDLVLDAGQLPIREPSTVIDTTLDEPTVLRQGDILLSRQRRINTTSPKETIAFGAKLVEKYKQYIGFKSLVLCLQGEMGAGKTQLTKGFAHALGVRGRIISPTFILEREYTFRYGHKRYLFSHIDAWRIVSNQEFFDLDFSQKIDQGAIIAVEWADRVASALQKYADEAKMLWVRIEYGTLPTERIISWGDLPVQKRIS